MKVIRVLLLVAAPSLAVAQLLPVASPERCADLRSAASAADWLARASRAVLPADVAGKVLRYRASYDIPYWEQSDRPYEPFVPNVTTWARWYNPTTKLEARHPVERPIRPNEYPSLLVSPTAVFAGRDSMARPVPQAMFGTAQIRRENPWMVVADWAADSANVRVVARCRYRDADRIVLQRRDERLYLSESDAMPIKLQRVEPHYLWGQVTAEYLWMNWWGLRNTEGGRFPLSMFRVFDGAVYERIGVSPGMAMMIPTDSAPRLDVPAVPPMAETIPPAPQTPDTVRIAERVYQLVTPMYTETVTLQRDTIFLLDATTSEARSRADSALIAALFPGRHPMVVVVTDLAWPHISGVRFWAARGATIVSHALSQDMLRRVVDRRWTLEPDALEKARAQSRFRFRPVTDSLRLAGGDVVVHALRGTTTEGAVGVWLPASRFFWAGDYVQNSPDSPYARDIVATIRSLALSPIKVGAQHIKPMDWAELVGRK